VNWRPGDRYRCQIDDSWWFGTVLEVIIFNRDSNPDLRAGKPQRYTTTLIAVQVSPFDSAVPDSPFLSVMCTWDSGEEERLSPWDLGKSKRIFVCLVYAGNGEEGGDIWLVQT
jgi:hypothetical protein